MSDTQAKRIEESNNMPNISLLEPVQADQEINRVQRQPKQPQNKIKTDVNWVDRNKEDRVKT